MAAAAAIPIIGGLLSSVSNLFGSVQNRKTQELYNEGQYLQYVTDKDLQEQQQETYLLLGAMVIIVIPAILFFKAQ